MWGPNPLLNPNFIPKSPNLHHKTLNSYQSSRIWIHFYPLHLPYFFLIWFLVLKNKTGKEKGDKNLEKIEIKKKIKIIKKEKKRYKKSETLTLVVFAIKVEIPNPSLTIIAHLSHCSTSPEATEPLTTHQPLFNILDSIVISLEQTQAPSSLPRTSIIIDH